MINQCDWYVLIWIICQLSGTFELPSWSTTLLQIIAILWALFLCPSRFLLRRNQPLLLNILSLIVLVYMVYGFYGILFSTPARLFFTGEPRPPYIYIRTALASFLPIYVFYEYSLRGLLTGNRIKIYFVIFLLVTILGYFANYQTLILQAKSKGIEMTETTNNVGYDFLDLLPFLIFYYRKPIFQYLFLIIIMGFIVSSMKRGAIFIGVICFFLLLFHNISKADNLKLKYISFLFGCCTLFFSVLYVNHMLESSDYFNRRVRDTENGYSSHRDVLYAKIYEAIVYDESLGHALIGRGADSTIRISGNYAHQDWLEVACNNGLLGICLMLAFYAIFCNTVRKSNYQLSSHFFVSFEMLFIICFVKTMFSMSFTAMGTTTTMLFGFLLAKERRSLEC